jgi:threonine/homoserine/homoserine lactone efflux protein
MASALAFSVVKYVGAAYLMYLGIRSLLSRADVAADENATPRDFSQLFAKGFLVNLLNPKTALFFYAFLPQFVDPSRGSTVFQILFLGGLFVLLATCTDSTYAVIGSSVGRLVMNRTGFQKARRYVTGGIYIALGVVAAAIGHGRGA